MTFGNERRSRRRWGAAVALALLLGLAAGAAIRSSSGTTPSVARPGTSPPASSDDGRQTDTAGSRDQAVPAVAGPGPWSLDHGVGVGFERSEAGAVAAATSYATAAQSWLYLADADVAEAADAVIVPESRQQLVPRLVEDVRLLRDQLTEASGTVWYVVAPLATSLDSYDPARTVARVWVVRVLAAEGVAVPQSSWRILTFSLEWSAGDWRVADVGESDGPTPQLEAGSEPWSAGYLDRTLAGFVRVGVR